MSEHRRQRTVKLVLAIGLPMPFIIPRFRKSSKRSFASTSVAISEGVLSSSGLSAGRSSAKLVTKPVSDVVAGALARAASQGTIHPLDTLKVRLQANKGAKLAGGLSKFGQLVPPPGAGHLSFGLRNLGASVASLYRGVVGAASGAGIAIGAYFAFYSTASNVISSHTDLAPGSVAFCAGAIAAAGSSVVKVPLAVCIRSVQAGVYPNVPSAAYSIVKAAGVRGLFTGYLPTLLEDVPDMAVKFAAYESLRALHKSMSNGREASPHEDFCIGAFSGALAAAATTPLDVVKTNMMCMAASKPTMASAAAAVYVQGGIPAFFTGIQARALSNGINSAVFFCFFEAIRKNMVHREQTLAAEKVEVGRDAKLDLASTAEPLEVTVGSFRTNGTKSQEEL